jgi:hypothetical protein
MAEPRSETSQRRLGERAQVRRAAIVIETHKRLGRTKERLVDAEVRDVSITGALLVVPADTPLQAFQVCELEIVRDRGRIRIRRLEPDGADLLAGVEFIDPRPAFLPTIHQWLDG